MNVQFRESFARDLRAIRDRFVLAKVNAVDSNTGNWYVRSMACDVLLWGVNWGSAAMVPAVNAWQP